jgi:hypothetical protein
LRSRLGLHFGNAQRHRLCHSIIDRRTLGFGHLLGSGNRISNHSIG